MVRPRWALSFIFRLGAAFMLLVFGLLLAFNWIGQQLPSMTVVYAYNAKVNIFDIGRGLELGLASDYPLAVGFPNITPVTSPDKQRIVTPNDRENIQIFDLAQGTRTLLPLAFAQPVWSPDSRYIANISLQGEESSAIQSNAFWMTIEVADVRSGEVRQIVPPYRYLRIWALRWSADSQFMTFVAMKTPTPDYNFYRVNRDGSDFHELDCILSSGGPDQMMNFSFAPNREQVAFSARKNQMYRIFMLNLRDCTQSQITDGERYDDYPVWSADGQHIAFLSTRDGQLDIYVMDANGQHVSRLTDTPEYELQLSWSPDSQRLLFASYSTASGVTTHSYADLRDNSLHHLDLHQGNNPLSFPAWGP